MPAGSTESWTARLGLAAAITVVSLLAYWPGVDGELVSDDRNAIVNNEFLRGPVARIFTEPSWWGSARGDAPGYRPLTTLSFAINQRLTGTSPRAYHTTNILLHAAVCCLLLSVAAALGLGPLASATAAVLFALMPVHSEAVLWVVGRADLLATAGLLTGLLVIIAYRRHARVWLLGAAALTAAAGMLAKESAIALLVAPPLLALLLPLPAAARKRDLHMLLALAAGLAGAWWMRTELAGHMFGAAAGDLLDNPLAGLPAATRLAGALSVFGRYMWLLIWPDTLSVDYSYNALGIGPGFVADGYSALGLAAISGFALLLWHWRRYPVEAFSLLLAGACYAPVSNVLLPIGTTMGERLFYLPSAGICLALAPALARLLARRPAAAGLIATVVAAAWLTVSMDRARDWRDPVSLFGSAVAAQPNSARARMELASAYGHAGRTEEALAEFDQALAIYPGYMSAWYNRGNLLARSGRYEEAARAYLEAIALVDNFEPAWFNLGLTRRLQGRPAEASRALARAAKLRGGAKLQPGLTADNLADSGN